MKHFSHNFSELMARMMILSTCFAAIIILLGTCWYLLAHFREYPGNHIFFGEPQYFTNPIDMAKKACTFSALGERRSFIMIGIFLLLMNPILRVLFASISYALKKNYLYLFISLLVFAILMASFLG
ncbi:MAG: hypothetical protein A3F67_04575 [Verrucomicrobia bacterium RIFCSPHIGHO2_12_FULL_41_10]|nr:MAG: hypothetical protein A3F67_04575 [Verrucomicrobia bacterium RIFCSPHIGHO2_12_FULL_41_10]HLB33765.1 DUF1634 domain-containing protein [Chthoniobacterales bacterium]